MGLCPVSAITQEPNENRIAFLERLKEAFQKFTNLDLDSYEGWVILKDKFLSQCASDIRIKLQQLTGNRRRPRPRRRRERKRQGMPRCWLPSRETLWQTLSP